MAVTTEAYKDHSILLTKEENQSANLQIDDRTVAYAILKNGHFHSDLIPYQNFEHLIDLAKSIIDYLPNVAFESN